MKLKIVFVTREKIKLKTVIVTCGFKFPHY